MDDRGTIQRALERLSGKLTGTRGQSGRKCLPRKYSWSTTGHVAGNNTGTGSTMTRTRSWPLRGRGAPRKTVNYEQMLREMQEDENEEGAWDDQLDWDDVADPDFQDSGNPSMRIAMATKMMIMMERRKVDVSVV